MKKIILFLIPCIALVGCASSGNVKGLSTFSPFGVVSVSSNSEVTWFGEEKKSSGMLGDTLRIAVKSQNNGLVTKADEILATTLNKASGIRVIDKKTILNSKTYVSSKENMMAKLSDLVQPAGYKFINQKDAAFVAKMAEETGVTGNIYVTFNFTKRIVTGIAKNGSMGAYVTMNVIIMNASGKPVLQKSYYGASDQNIMLIAGVYDPMALLNLFPTAITAACQSFANDIVQ